MKKIISVIIICILLCSMIVPVSAANTYQCAGFTFESELDYETNEGYESGTEYEVDSQDGIRWDFTISNPVTGEDMGQMVVCEKIQPCTDEFFCLSPEEYPGLLDWYRESAFEDGYETKIDGCPALVEKEDDTGYYQAVVVTYDDTFFYVIGILCEEEAHRDAILANILNADLNNPLPGTKITYTEIDSDLCYGETKTIELNSPEGNKPSLIPEEESLENGIGAEEDKDKTESVKDDIEKDDKNDDDEDKSYVKEEDNTIVIVIGVVACVAIICGMVITIFVMKSKKK